MEVFRLEFRNTVSLVCGEMGILKASILEKGYVFGVPRRGSSCNFSGTEPTGGVT